MFPGFRRLEKIQRARFERELVLAREQFQAEAQLREDASRQEVARRNREAALAERRQKTISTRGHQGVRGGRNDNRRGTSRDAACCTTDSSTARPRDEFSPNSDHGLILAGTTSAVIGGVAEQASNSVLPLMVDHVQRANTLTTTRKKFEALPSAPPLEQEGDAGAAVCSVDAQPSLAFSHAPTLLALEDLSRQRSVGRTVGRSRSHEAECRRAFLELRREAREEQRREASAERRRQWEEKERNRELQVEKREAEKQKEVRKKRRRRRQREKQRQEAIFTMAAAANGDPRGASVDPGCRGQHEETDFLSSVYQQYERVGADDPDAEVRLGSQSSSVPEGRNEADGLVNGHAGRERETRREAARARAATVRAKREEILRQRAEKFRVSQERRDLEVAARKEGLEEQRLARWEGKRQKREIMVGANSVCTTGGATTARRSCLLPQSALAQASGGRRESLFGELVGQGALGEEDLHLQHGSAPGGTFLTALTSGLLQDAPGGGEQHMISGGDSNQLQLCDGARHQDHLAAFSGANHHQRVAKAKSSTNSKQQGLLQVQPRDRADELAARREKKEQRRQRNFSFAQKRYWCLKHQFERMRDALRRSRGFLKKPPLYEGEDEGAEDGMSPTDMMNLQFGGAAAVAAMTPAEAVAPQKAKKKKLAAVLPAVDEVWKSVVREQQGGRAAASTAGHTTTQLQLQDQLQHPDVDSQQQLKKHRRKMRCGLCELEFLEENLPTRITQTRVDKLRKDFLDRSEDEVLKELAKNGVGTSTYDKVPLCTFCLHIAKHHIESEKLQ